MGEFKLGYLVLGVRRPAAWEAFCRDVLGLQPTAAGEGALRGWRMDDAAHRLMVGPGDDDVIAIGLEFGSAPALDDRVRAMRQSGVAVREAPAELAASRRVRRLYCMTDPAGTALELFAGLDVAREPFRSELFPAGFVTGELGIGHAVLTVPDVERVVDFYTTVLGFAITERLQTRVGPVSFKGVFLHCNRRHHSLAVFNLPSRKRLQHFMLEVPHAAQVARAFDRAQAAGVPLSLTLGQHPDPDGTFSFYGVTPSGFDFEIGAGGGLIEPGAWRVRENTVTSSWGHRPVLGAKVRLMRELVISKFGRGKPARPQAPTGA